MKARSGDRLIDHLHVEGDFTARAKLYRYNLSGRLDQRAAAGLGYGLQLLEDSAANVSVRGGLDYVAVERFVARRHARANGMAS